MSSGFRPENFNNSSPDAAEGTTGAVPGEWHLGEWHLGEWRVLAASHELIDVEGRRVRLEARAMHLLAVLHEKAGQVVTTEDLLDRVWAGKVVTPHSVANVVSDLRKALGPRNARVIETIPKRGYRLELLSTRIPTTAPAATAIPTAASSTVSPASSPRGATRRRATFAAAGSAGAILVVGVLWISGVDSFGIKRTQAVESGRTALFLRARQLWSLREHDAMLEARRILQELIAADAGFAPAHAALADIYAHKTGVDLGVSELDTFREAQRHLDRARALDADLPEAFVTQAILDFYRDDQAQKALVSVDAALMRDAGFAYAWQTRAMLLSALGRHEDSLAAVTRARDLDPSSQSIRWDEVWFLYLAGEAERAHAALARESQRSQPNYLYGALIEQQRGNERAALEMWLARLERRGAKLPDPSAVQAQAAGDARGAYRELLRQVRLVPDYRESSVVLAAWTLLAGDADQARSMLAGQSPDRNNWLTFWMQELPVLAPLYEAGGRDDRGESTAL